MQRAQLLRQLQIDSQRCRGDLEGRTRAAPPGFSAFLGLLAAPLGRTVRAM